MGHRRSCLVLTLFYLLSQPFGCQAHHPSNATNIQVNALVGLNGASAVQCWKIEPPLLISSQSGTVGARIQRLGDMTGATLVYFDPDHPTNAGLHRAPAPQWVVTLTGHGTVTLPATNKTLQLPSGGVIIANDTADVSQLGHNTKWAKGSIVLQLPFRAGVPPNHTVVNEGPCDMEEVD